MIKCSGNAFYKSISTLILDSDKNLIKTKYIWEEPWSPIKKILVQNWIKSEIRGCKLAITAPKNFENFNTLGDKKIKKSVKKNFVETNRSAILRHSWVDVLL